MRREAELSSRIEQTYASVRTMLLQEHLFDIRESEDVREVQNNYQVLLDGLDAVRDRPITLGLIRQLHRSLFDGVDDPKAKPGQLRSIPVFIGETNDIREARFVPPPPLEVEPSMRALESFVRQTGDLPTVVRAALAHYQFETIHPFNDGNGRIGRALIMLMLVSEGLLTVPLLNPSAGLERRRREYYDRLLDVSQRGEWGAWVHFFCTCVAEEAAHSEAILEKLDMLRIDYHARIRRTRGNASIARLIDELFTEPKQTAASVQAILSLSSPTAANNTIQRLEKVGILQEVTGRKRGRAYLATEIVDLFSTSKSRRTPKQRNPGNAGK